MVARIGAAPVWETGAAGDNPTYRGFIVFLGEGASDVLLGQWPGRSGFADRLEDRGGQRVGGALASPHDILKGGVEALAFGDRDLDQVIQLLGAQALGAPERDGEEEQ